MKNFTELCDEIKASIEERRILAYHLASYRMRKTLEALLPIKVEIK